MMTGPPEPRPPAPRQAEPSAGHRLTIDVVHPGTRLRMAGRLDARSASGARSTLHDAVDSGEGELVLEMNQLEIWDGAGLGIMVGTARRVRQVDRQLVLTGVQARELRLLRVARVTWSSSVHLAALVS